MRIVQHMPTSYKDLAPLAIVSSYDTQQIMPIYALSIAVLPLEWGDTYPN